MWIATRCGALSGRVALKIQCLIYAVVAVMLSALNFTTSVQAQVATATDGIAVFEAENYTAHVPRNGRSWELLTSPTGYVDAGFMVVTNSPDPASNVNVNVTGSCPELQYSVDFPITGTYRVWVRGYGNDGTEDSIHTGLDGAINTAGSNLTWSTYGAWVWTNGLSKSVTVSSTGLHTFNVWMREDGARVDRFLLTDNVNFKATIGNAFHIPNNNQDDLPRPTMRFPLSAIMSNTAVEIYNGNQFQGPGNPGNQLGIGSTVFYKITTNTSWSSLPMSFVAQGVANTNNKYFGATIPSGTFKAGDVVQYYIRVPYSDHLPTYLYGTDSTRNETENESIAQSAPYTFTVQPPYLSVTSMIPEGTVEARVFVNSGDVMVTGPDLNGTPFATTLYYTPAAKIGGVMHNVGAVLSSFPISGGVEMSQQLSSGVITSRLTVVDQGVLRYEIIHFGSMPIEETLITSPSDSAEHFFGLGEKFNSVDQTGNNVRMLTWDPAGNKGDLSYKVVPWFLSTRGYGFHLDSTALSYFDLRAASGNSIMVSNKFASLKFNVVYGPRLPDALTRYTGYTGRPAQSPLWAYGAWMSSDHWRDGGELRYVVTKMKERGIPGSAFVFDSPWEIAYNDLTWNMTQFANSGTYEGTNWAGFANIGDMMGFFRTNGWKIICWMTPFINRSSNNEGVPGANLGLASTYTFASNNGYFVRSGAINGPALVAPWWKGSGSPVDFTRNTAAKWWMLQLSNLVTESGGVIGGWKTDDGETSNGGNVYIPESAHYSDGRTGKEMQNGYCVEYHKTVWSVLGTNGILFARSGFTGSQSYPGYWSGDNEPNFGQNNGLLSVIVAGQSAGLCGFSIWGHDIGGYQVESNPSSSITNLFMRWTQFGAFSPLFQLHRKVAGSEQYPWSYGAAALNNYRFYAQLHQSLSPYIYSYARISESNGLPIMRHPVLMNQTDSNTYGIDHSYYFGEELFVAPATTPNQNERSLYLPPGQWYDFWTNRSYSGSQIVVWTNTDQTKIAVFARAGAIIPMIATNIQTLLDVDYIGHTNLITPDNAIEFLVYPNTNSSFTMYDGTAAQCTSNNTVVTFSLNASARPVSLRLRSGQPAGVQLDGVRLPVYTNAAEFNNAPYGWRYDASSAFVLVKYVHGGGTAQVTLGPDTVGDGIPNSWRDYFFDDATTTNGDTCASCDADNDGQSNRDEYYSGTNPDDTNSYIRIQSEYLQMAGGSNLVVVSWPSQLGIPYSLDWRSNMLDASPWYAITSRFTGSGNSLMWTDNGSETTNGSIHQRYYRIGVPY